MTPDQVRYFAQDLDFAVDVTIPREALLKRFEDVINRHVNGSETQEKEKS